MDQILSFFQDISRAGTEMALFTIGNFFFTKLCNLLFNLGISDVLYTMLWDHLKHSNVQNDMMMFQCRIAY